MLPSSAGADPGKQADAIRNYYEKGRAAGALAAAAPLVVFVQRPRSLGVVRCFAFRPLLLAGLLLPPHLSPPAPSSMPGAGYFTPAEYDAGIAGIPEAIQAARTAGNTTEEEGRQQQQGGGGARRGMSSR